MSSNPNDASSFLGSTDTKKIKMDHPIDPLERNYPDPTFRQSMRDSQKRWTQAPYKKTLGTVMWGCFFVYAGYKIGSSWYYKTVERTKSKPIHATAPFVESHNKFWGLAHDEVTTQGTPKYLLDAEIDEPVFEEPKLIVSERSEAFPDCDVAVMQITDWDTHDRKKAFFRTMHFIPHDLDAAKAASNKKGTKPVIAPDIQTMLKCIDITDSNNCIGEHRTLFSEHARKLMVGITLTSVLENAKEHMYPTNWSRGTKHHRKVLMVGMGGAAIPQYMNRILPQFHFDIVEVDATVVRYAKRYFGFLERTGNRIFVEDGSEFMRENAVTGRNRYDVIMCDAWDTSGRIPIHLSRLEFLNNVRKSLNERGVFIATIPNKDPKVLATTVANWRLAFESRTLVLLHCKTEPVTIAMTFSDEGPIGTIHMGTVGGRAEFQELIRSFLLYNGSFNLDLTKEITDESFQQLLPGKKYTLNNITI
eukprot:PhF_6_TR23826/c0_g1_i3/m.33395